MDETLTMKKIPIIELRWRGELLGTKLILTHRALCLFSERFTTEEAMEILEMNNYLDKPIITGCIVLESEDREKRNLINLEPVEEEGITKDLLKRAFVNDPVFFSDYRNFKVYYGSKELGRLKEL